MQLCVPLNEGGGTPIDIIKNRKSTFAVEADISWKHLLSGPSLNFADTASRHYVDFTDLNELDGLTELSIFCRFRTSTLTGGGNSLRNVVDKNGPSEGWITRLATATDNMYFYVYTTTYYGINTDSNSIKANVWFNMLCSYHGTTKELKIVLLADDDSYFKIHKTTIANGGAIGVTANPLTIGGNASTADSIRMWAGDIEAVYIWNRHFKDDEGQSICINPYQIFETPRKIFSVPTVTYTVSGTVKNYDDTAVYNQTGIVKYSGDVSGSANTNVTGDYSFTVPEGSSIKVWVEWNSWHFDQDPTATQDWWDLPNITANQTSKNFKIRNTTDAQWPTGLREYATRIPITFGASHSSYLGGTTAKVTAALGRHKRIHNRGAYTQAVQEMSNSVVRYKGKTHLAWIGHEDLDLTGLSIFTITYDEQSKTWGSVNTVVSGIGEDTHFYATMAVDNLGYIIMTYGWHDNHGGKLLRSNAVNDVSAFTQLKDLEAAGFLGSYPQLAVASFGGSGHGRYYIFMRTYVGAVRDAMQYIYSDDPTGTWSGPYYITYTEAQSGINDPHAHYPFGFRQYSDMVMFLWSLRHNYGEGANWDAVSAVFMQGDLQNNSNGTGNWRKADGTAYDTGNPSSTKTSAPARATITPSFDNLEYLYKRTTGDYCNALDVAKDSSGNIYGLYHKYSSSTIGPAVGPCAGKIRKWTSGGGWAAEQSLWTDAGFFVSGAMYIDNNDYIWCLYGDLNGKLGFYQSSDGGSSFVTRTVSDNNHHMIQRFVFAYDSVLDRVDAFTTHGNDVMFLSFDHGVDFYSTGNDVRLVWADTEYDAQIKGLMGSQDNDIFFKLQTDVSSNKETDRTKPYNIYSGNENATSPARNFDNVYTAYEGFEDLTVDSTLNGQGGWVFSAAGRDGEIKVENGNSNLLLHARTYERKQFATLAVTATGELYAYRNISGTDLYDRIIEARLIREASTGRLYVAAKNGANLFKVGHNGSVWSYTTANGATWNTTTNAVSNGIHQRVKLVIKSSGGASAYDSEDNLIGSDTGFTGGMRDLAFGATASTDGRVDDIVSYYAPSGATTFPVAVANTNQYNGFFSSLAIGLFRTVYKTQLITATAIPSLTPRRTLLKTFLSTATAVVGLFRGYKKTFTVIATGVISFSLSKLLLKSFAITATGVASLNRKLFRSSATTATSNVSLNRKISRDSLTTATASISLNRTISKAFLSIATSIPGLKRLIGRRQTVTAVAVPSLQTKRTLLKSFLATATAQINLNLARLKLFSFLASATGISSLNRKIGRRSQTTATSNVSLNRQIGRKLSSVAVSVPGLKRLIGRKLTATATAVPSMQFGRALVKLFSVVTTAQVSMNLSRLKLFTFLATASGLSSLSRKISRRSQATTISNISLNRKISKNFVVAATSVVSLMRTIGRKLQVTATGVVSLSFQKIVGIYHITLACVATAQISLGLKRSLKKQLAAVVAANVGLNRKISRNLFATAVSVVSFNLSFNPITKILFTLIQLIKAKFSTRSLNTADLESRVLAQAEPQTGDLTDPGLSGQELKKHTLADRQLLRSAK